MYFPSFPQLSFSHPWKEALTDTQTEQPSTGAALASDKIIHKDKSLEHLTNASTSSQFSLPGVGKIDCSVNLINGSSLYFFSAWTLLGLRLHCSAENQSGIFQTAANCRNAIENNLMIFSSALRKSMQSSVGLVHTCASGWGSGAGKEDEKGSRIHGGVPNPGQID